MISIQNILAQKLRRKLKSQSLIPDLEQSTKKTLIEVYPVKKRPETILAPEMKRTKSGLEVLRLRSKQIGQKNDLKGKKEKLEPAKAKVVKRRRNLSLQKDEPYSERLPYHHRRSESDTLRYSNLVAQIKKHSNKSMRQN